MMTALLTLENVDDLNTLVEVTEEDFPCVESISPKPDSEIGMPVIDLLYGLMLPSGNEAANTLARYVGGSADKFVEMMNDRAKELGCENTHFMNPNGLHNEDHYTTARDLYTITQRAMQDETFQLIVNTAQKTLSKNNMTSERGGKPLKVYTTNMLIFSRHQTAYYYAYAKGIKTWRHLTGGLLSGCRRREKRRQADFGHARLRTPRGRGTAGHLCGNPPHV